MARGFNYAPGASAEVQEAMQQGLHKSHIMALGASKNSLVRATVAARPDCPLGLMVTLAHDYSAEVRACVARNPVAQRTVMAYLSADRSVEVLKALLDNPALPAELLEELAFHRKAEVRAAAAARLDGDAAPAAAAVMEDAHTPELAEHVAPQRMTAVDAVAATASFMPVNVADTTTGAPLAAPAYPVALVAPAAAPASPGTAWTVPQIFAPHSTPTSPAPTRTAPVRGFKVR